MNVKEAAARFNVSTTAIYNQLNKLESKGRQGKNGTITEEGFNFLESIYSTSNQLESTLNEELKKQLQAEAERKLAAQDHEIELLTEKLKAAEQFVESLQEKLQSASDQHDKDIAAIERMQGTVEAQTATIQAQAMTAAAQAASIQTMQQNMQRLPAAPQTLRQAIAGWISSKRKGS